MQTATPPVKDNLKDQWISFRKEQPRTRIRDAAAILGTTEAEILAAFAGSSVLQLTNQFGPLFKRLPELGYVMSLTRNDHCVHERKGIFENVSVNNPHIGLVVGPDIDLRMFLQQWAFAFAVFENEEAGFKRSIQIFDRQGIAIIKIYLTESSNVEAFETLVRAFQAPGQQPALSVQPAPAAHVFANEKVDVEVFRKAWSELQDTHDFFPLLKKHNISRLHALTIAGDFARQVPNDTATHMLQTASAGGWDIMVFVGNPGNIQIHTGPVHKIVEIPGWINVMDPAFNLHLKLEGISSTWAVMKPTSEGPVHSLELFDAKGEMIVQFFGKRKPGIPELKVWADYVKGL